MQTNKIVRIGLQSGAVVFFTALLAAGSAWAAWDFAAGDADRDGLDDLAFIGNGEWYVWLSAQGYAMQGPYDMELCGGTYVLGDVDGDAQPDLLMLSDANWFAWRSTQNYALEGPINCGVEGMPYLYDFDGDGKQDPCVVAANYLWYVWLSGSDYAQHAPFGFNPGVPGDFYPVAFRIQVLPAPYQRFYQIIGLMVNGQLHLRRLDNLSYQNQPLDIAPGMPVVGYFDGHQGIDLLTLQRQPDSYWFYTLFSSENWEKRGPFKLPMQDRPGVAGLAWTDTNGCYAVVSVYDVVDITNAAVDINGMPLTYNPAFSFSTATGYNITVSLPYYYAALTNIHGGDVLTLSVYTNGALMYRSAPTVLPEQVLLVEPQDGARLLLGQPVLMSWSAVTNCNGYLVSYFGPDDYTPSTDGGWHINYLDAAQTAYTVPADCTITGYAEFGVAALNGDVASLLGPEDTNDSFFVAGSWDETETVVDTPVTDPLFIAKEYSRNEKGLRFTVRESDPYQMPYPGTVTVQLKLRRWKISIAFVAAYDMNGNQYFFWMKDRIFKRKNKHYTVTFACQPGSTIAIGTHDAAFQGASYTY